MARTLRGDWHVKGKLTADGMPVDIGTSIEAAPTASQVLLRFAAHKPLKIKADSSLVKALAGVAATAQTDLSLQKVLAADPAGGGTEFAVLRFAAAGKVATLTSATETTLAVGDQLLIVAPAYADDTLAKIAVTIRALPN